MQQFIFQRVRSIPRRKLAHRHVTPRHVTLAFTYIQPLAFRVARAIDIEHFLQKGNSFGHRKALAEKKPLPQPSICGVRSRHVGHRAPLSPASRVLSPVSSASKLYRRTLPLPSWRSRQTAICTVLQALRLDFPLRGSVVSQAGKQGLAGRASGCTIIALLTRRLDDCVRPSHCVSAAA